MDEDNAYSMEHPAADFSVFTASVDMSTPFFCVPSLYWNIYDKEQNDAFWEFADGQKAFQLSPDSKT